MGYIKILIEYFGREKIFLSKRRKLIVFLGSFADFDSFEYCQHIASQSNLLDQYSLDLIVVGIGSQKTKEYFCKFNKIDVQNVFAVENAELHEKLNLNEGFSSPMSSIINLLIMCAGINSRGTLREVIRGYLGDGNSNSLFRPEEYIKLGPFNLFKGKMFDIFSKKKTLRPFELATRRLMNMIEILSNWNIYVPDSSFLTQRGATLLLNENEEVLYEFISEGLLGYSSKMSAPLSFIDDCLS